MQALAKLRQTMRAARAALNSDAQESAAQHVLAQFASLPFINHYQHIGVYHAINGELEPKFIVNYLWQQQKSCYLPIIVGHPDKTLVFKAYTENTVLTYNRFGIPEPLHGLTCDADALDLLLLPVVAFDRKGHRLGMGGGFYDYTLRHRKNKPFLLGLAYAFQEVAQLTPKETDVKLDAIITEGYQVIF